FSLGAKTNGDGKLTYKSSNTKVARVDKNGKITIRGCGRAKITIKASKTDKYNEASKTVTITVKPKQEKITSIKSLKSNTITVKWRKDTKATGYRIQYSTDKNFKKNVKTVWIKKNTITSKTITKLKAGKKYYVRVAAINKTDGRKIYGASSTIRSVKVKK
ncbi:MAG: fibronectin type III domain-containing protein, partial [Coprococcus sp.]